MGTGVREIWALRFALHKEALMGGGWGPEFQWQLETCGEAGTACRAPTTCEDKNRDGNKKRALTDRPSELNHFDDTLAGSEVPAQANHHEEQRP